MEAMSDELRAASYSYQSEVSNLKLGIQELCPTNVILA
jgi:hypothetical protein